jgi:hypothetical protein
LGCLQIKVAAVELLVAEVVMSYPGGAAGDHRRIIRGENARSFASLPKMFEANT